MWLHETCVWMTFGFGIGSSCIWHSKSDGGRCSGFKSSVVSIFLITEGGLQSRGGKDAELITKNFNKQFIKPFCLLL